MRAVPRWPCSPRDQAWLVCVAPALRPPPHPGARASTDLRGRKLCGPSHLSSFSPSWGYSLMGNVSEQVATVSGCRGPQKLLTLYPGKAITALLLCPSDRPTAAGGRWGGDGVWRQ